jgi:hypothetical protein
MPEHKPPQKTQETGARRLLKTACCVGVIALPLLVGALVYISVATGASPFKTTSKEGANWSTKLSDFDHLFSQYGQNPLQVNPELLSSILDSLETASAGAQSRLSLLKRRRALAAFARAAGNSAFVSAAAEQHAAFFKTAYRTATQKAAADFPYSAPVHALACEALFWHTGRLDDLQRQELQRLAEPLLQTGTLTEGTYLPLAFSFLSAGDTFPRLEDALSHPRAAALFAVAALRTTWPPRAGETQQPLLLDAALIHLLKSTAAGGADSGADTAALVSALDAFDDATGKTLRFLADYYFDFGDLNRAGELFARLGGAENLEMAGAALYLANNPASAMNFWRALSEGDSIKTTPQMRARYNLASRGNAALSTQEAAPETGAEQDSAPPSPDPRQLPEARTYIKGLEEILVFGAGQPEYEAITIPALTLYTRFFPAARALAILDGDTRTQTSPLLDMEAIKRRALQAGIQKTAGETWRLLNRHATNAPVYQWAAWFFEYQHLYSEAEAIRYVASRNKIDTPQVTLNESFARIRHEDYEGAEQTLAALKAHAPAPDETPLYQHDQAASHANLGLLQEARHAQAAALENYETALHILAANPQSPPTIRRKAARLYILTARLYNTRQRTSESRTALAAALALDPDNINIHFALSRLGNR